MPGYESTNSHLNSLFIYSFTCVNKVMELISSCDLTLYDFNKQINIFVNPLKLVSCCVVLESKV